ncbi:MAG TPA: hypothetical protein VLV83_18985 [Acidobacteriota bacterium]|nr:hypothetical protein [Acidobacteriota bacterium]
MQRLIPFLFAPLLLTASLVPAWASSSPSSPAGPSDTREVRYLTFTAKDRHDIYLRSLERDEVRLSIDGKPVDVGYLGGSDADTEFIFLVENSHRTAEYNVSQAQWGQVNIIDRVRASLMDGFLYDITRRGPAMLAQFGFETEILQDFTRHDDEIIWALRKIKPQPNEVEMRDIPVGRQMLWAFDILRRRDAMRKILVMFTTYIDRESLTNLDEYRDTLGLYDVELYVVSFGSRAQSSVGTRHEVRMNRYFFKKLADATSGKFYLTGEHVYMSDFMDDLKARLSHSWTIGFYVTPGEKRREHDIDIKIGQKDDKIKVIHREKLVY